MRAFSEDVILYLVIGIVGLIPIGITIEQRTAFGAESTIGVLMLGVAIGGLLALWRVASKARPRR